MTSKTFFTCRFCNTDLTTIFIDLGMSPVANSYVKKMDQNKAEAFYPLCTYICKKCLLVQLPEHEKAENIFSSDYAYFSSYSDSWLRHAKDYVEAVTTRFELNKTHQVIEVASNDGYLLQYFQEKGIPVLGIEPTANTARVARSKGIKTVVEFFGTKLAKKLKKDGIKADLLLGNNVLAHVPNLNDFIAGMAIILKDTGIITMEFPHLLKLIQYNQFDTIYHEHFSYFSFLTILNIFAHHGITLFDVEEIPTHGGSIRIFGKLKENKQIKMSVRVEDMMRKEREYGLDKVKTYLNFEEKIQEVKLGLLEFLIKEKRKGKVIAAYGAPAKGNTLLNYCGIRTDFIDYTVDRSPHKQNLLLPGTHIPIYSPERIKETKPDYVFILPWNLKTEVTKQHEYIRSWGGKFITAIPHIKVL